MSLAFTLRVQPDFGDQFLAFLSENAISPRLSQHIGQAVSRVNEQIVQDPNLGSGFQIGHSYFCISGVGEDFDEEAWYHEVLNFEVNPSWKQVCG